MWGDTDSEDDEAFLKRGINWRASAQRTKK
jgi:hypothetical protein